MSDSSISPSKALSSQLSWGHAVRKAPTAAPPLNLEPQQQKHPEPQLKSPMFEDAEIDELLTRLGLKPNKELRSAARLLMRHHFQLSRPLLDITMKILPHGPWENHGPAEALMAALSRLPLEDVENGYRILLSAFTSKKPTVMGLLHIVVGQLQDLISQWIVSPPEQIPSQILIPALEEELSQWQQILKMPIQQLALLISRKDLIHDFRRLHLLFQSLQRLLHRKDQPPHKLQIQLASLQQDMRHALDLLLGDLILSKDDQAHHFKEQGQCCTLGLWRDRELQACRMWSDGDSGIDADDDPSWWFRLHWNDTNTGELMAEAQLIGSEGELTFFSNDEQTRQQLSDTSEELTRRLDDSGFSLELNEIQDIKANEDPASELHHNSSGPLKHIDSQA